MLSLGTLSYGCRKETSPEDRFSRIQINLPPLPASRLKTPIFFPFLKKKRTHVEMLRDKKYLVRQSTLPPHERPISSPLAPSSPPPQRKEGMDRK